MSRAIKFRAWAVDIENGGHKLWKPFSLDWYKEGLDAPDGFTANRYGAWPSDTVFMQYTGLKDKNGKEIYEGDIVKISSCDEPCSYDGILTNIIWSKHDCGYRGRYPEINLGAWHEDVEVVGNIYEHPDLINGI